MHPLWRLATLSWRTSKGRTAAAVLSIALGVATVVVMTSFYETARSAIEQEVVNHWLGAADLSIQPPGAHWGALEADLAPAIARLANVEHVTARLRRRMSIFPAPTEEQLIAPSGWWADAIGIDPETELRFRTFPGLQGRMIAPGERGVALLERGAAERLGLVLGDPFRLATSREGDKITLQLIGLIESERLADFQQPYVYASLADVQTLAGEPGAVSAIDLMLLDTAPAALADTKARVEALIEERKPGSQYRVESAEGRQLILNEADRISRLALMLAATATLLTSFFIIVTTMSMSLYQRRTALGIMRCVGLTRGQLVKLLLLELLPLGVVGTALGVGLGIVVARITPRLTSELDLEIVFSAWGIGLATASGLITTLAGLGVLLFQVCRVQPLAAVHTEARPARRSTLYLCGALGIVFLALHELFVRVDDQTQWLHAAFASFGALSIYLGYILLTPMLVLLLGKPLARLTGPLLGIRGALAVDQFGRSPWRSTGVCWVLLAGLSLTVYMGISSEAFKAIWNFPGALPDTFVWTRQYVDGEAVQRVLALPGIESVTAAVDVDCTFRKTDDKPKSRPGSFVGTILRKLSRPVFVACDIEKLLDIVKIDFIEGSREEALRKLVGGGPDRSGGYVLIPAQTALYHDLHLGERITLTIKDRSADFEIAGVVQSPALDLAVTAFRATSYMEFAASAAILGTRADLKDKFGLDVVAMFMLDLDLPETPAPDDFHRAAPPDPMKDRAVAAALLRWRENLPLEATALAAMADPLQRFLAEESVETAPEKLRNSLRRYAHTLKWLSFHWDRYTPQENWGRFRERLVLSRVATEIDRPSAVKGSLRRLKQGVDRAVQRSTVLITWLPSIVLVVAAIGIANLMMVSVYMRARQLAVLRAVGALKSQIVRLVLAEAIALGLLGSLIGVALGIHQGYSDNRVTAGLIGFHPEFIIPLDTIALGVLATVSVCLLAGIAPALRAARSNIVQAMQTT